ncbi:MAG TPA: thiamine-phosphate kinase [Nitrososphaeraceae archaeon]|jgi:thiamine-monophosphate kinase
MKRLNEREIIDIFTSNINDPLLDKVKNDDVVILPLRYGILKRMNNTSSLIIVLKSDMLVESTDAPKIMKPWQIARKAILACVSDFAAKGIRPYACLISIGIPRNYSRKNIVSLAAGFSKASKEFNIRILGGDTNESKELIIDCNMVGFTTLQDNKIPRRKGAKAGDIIVTSGKFGYTSSGLKIILSNFNAEKKFKLKSLSSVTFPKPQVEFGFCLAKYFSSSIDSSDGLSSSLYELAQKSNKVDFLLNKIPTPKGIRDFSDLNSISIENLIFFGGEEYETIATVSRSNFKKMVRDAKKHNIQIYQIGEVLDGSGNVIYEERGTQKLVRNEGFVHFAK